MDGEQTHRYEASQALPADNLPNTDITDSLPAVLATNQLKVPSPNQVASPVTRRPGQPSTSTVLTLQDLLELPGQILPPETVHHLKNAGREAMLAVFSLWRSIDKATKSKSQSGEKVRKHIEVE